MARGNSGRIVLEIDPNLKRAVHARLAASGMTMKDWFLEQVDELLNPRQQELPLAAHYSQPPGTASKAAEPRSTYRRGDQ